MRAALPAAATRGFRIDRLPRILPGAVRERWLTPRHRP